MADTPIVKLAAPRSHLYLYADRLVERRDWPFASRVHPLIPGMEANVDDIGLGVDAAHSNWRYLTITGPGLVLTRTLNGPESIEIGVRFAAHFNAAVHALGAREARPDSATAPGDQR